jgi:hypothetical protein
MKRNTITDEQLSAYVDGELTSDLHAAIQQSLERDPALRERVDKLRKIDDMLNQTCSAIDEKPIPQSVVDLLVTAKVDSKPISFVNGLNELILGKQKLGFTFAAFTTLAIVAVSIPLVKHNNSATTYDSLMLSGAIDNSSELHQALDNTPSTQLVMLGEEGKFVVTPIYTFKSVTGDYCREFTQQINDQQARTIACRESGNWIIQLAATETKTNVASGSYTTASMTNSVKFDLFIDQHMANEALSQQDELDIIEKKWP